MSGYLGSDGSALAGGLNPSAVVQGLTVDAYGNLKTEDAIRAMIFNGQTFTAYEAATTGAAHTIAASLYSPGTKNVYIFRARVSPASGGSTMQIWTRSSDFALGSITAGAMNRNLGSATTSTCTLSGSSNASTSGTKTDESLAGANTIFEFIQNGAGIFIPAGTAFAVMLADVQAAAGYTSCSFDWFEF